LPRGRGPSGGRKPATAGEKRREDLRGCGSLAFTAACFGQAAYPEGEATAAWRGLAASYVRKAVREGTLDRDPLLNARADRIMAKVGAAAGALDPRFAGTGWTALLIADFGHGAAAFPGGIILVDATFARTLQLDDDELALILSHEAAHVLAGHAAAKLAFMAEYLGKERIPTASTALQEFLAKDSYAAVFQPRLRQQEREADALGAAILLAAATIRSGRWDCSTSLRGWRLPRACGFRMSTTPRPRASGRSPGRWRTCSGGARRAQRLASLLLPLDDHDVLDRGHALDPAGNLDGLVDVAAERTKPLN